MYHAAMSNAALMIERLRKQRVRGPREESLSEFMSITGAETRRTQAKLGRLIALWQDLVPRELVDHTALTGFRGGVLHVLADSAAVSFQLDRLLRCGLMDELRQRFNGTLTRVRVRVGRMES
jgi:hypothetical protein